MPDAQATDFCSVSSIDDLVQARILEKDLPILMKTTPAGGLRSSDADGMDAGRGQAGLEVSSEVMDGCGVLAEACPTVSVVTATHNRADVLPMAIASVRGQTQQVLEHIIVDDGSQDGTAELLQEAHGTHGNLAIIRQKRQGAASARNAGIEAARGKYIAFLDSDDLWMPQKIQRQVQFMEERASVFSYGSYVAQDRASGKILKTYHPPPMLTYRQLLGNCPIGCLTAAYDQEALGKVYMPAVARGQDWGLWLALTRNGTRALQYPGVEAVYVRSAGSLSANKLSKTVDMYRIFRQYEQLGRLRSCWHLACHPFYVLKRSLLGAGTNPGV